MEYDLVIIGGGSAGLFCAYEAVNRGFRVALIEHRDCLCSKLQIAGGGMGNMTNLSLCASEIFSHDRSHIMRHYVSRDDCEASYLLESLFRDFTCDDMLSLLSFFGISYEEREFGQIFCLEPVRNFIAHLESSCSSVDFYLGHSPKQIYYDRICDDIENVFFHYHVQIASKKIFSKNLVIATGSNVYPQIGASDFGLRLAKKWGHICHNFYPVLVPFSPKAQKSNPIDFKGLEGISLPVRIRVLGSKEKVDPCKVDLCDVRPLLFTHRGFSGPAALVASCFFSDSSVEQPEFIIDFLPYFDLKDAMHNPKNGKKNIKNLLLPHLPDRLAYRLIPENLLHKKVAEIGKKDREILEKRIHYASFFVEKNEGLKKAEAAAGGVSVKELHNSLESKRFKGLYFCGEVLDITGLLGGYNIHFALASAKRVVKSIEHVIAHNTNLTKV